MSIQVGILGFAHGHVSAYCEEWNKNPDYGVQIAAGWDHDSKRLENAAKTFGLRPCLELDEILTCSSFQAVVIGAETAKHADLVEQAAAAGKAIILQKPIAMTISEADRIINAVNQYGVPFTMAWQMQVDGQNKKMKELIEIGELGKVFMVRRRHGLSVGLTPGFEESWHVNPDLNRDIWADDASHPIDFIHWVARCSREHNS